MTGQSRASCGVEALAERTSCLRRMALAALGRMYRPEAGAFAFRLVRNGDGLCMQGQSWRYTAIALIGLAGEGAEAAAATLARQDPMDVCGRLVESVASSTDMGELALSLWAARAWGHHAAAVAASNLAWAGPQAGRCATVELAWCLSALTVGGLLDKRRRALADALAGCLLARFNASSGMFRHLSEGGGLRGHVSCFADAVYPIHALSWYHRATGDGRSASAAQACARRICDLQGQAGQWWWHYDWRTGKVIEQYPVYAVHQDAMAPMALSALKQCCGLDLTASAVKGLHWLDNAPERTPRLVDDKQGVIWRKVARREKWRLARAVQAGASRLHCNLRMPWMNALLPPCRVDWESRPYHMGWILYAWPNRDLSATVGLAA